MGREVPRFASPSSDIVHVGVVDQGCGGLHSGPAAHHVQVQHLIQEVVDGLVVVRRGPGLIVGPGREPGQPLHRGPAGGVQVIHHTGWNKLKEGVC